MNNQQLELLVRRKYGQQVLVDSSTSPKSSNKLKLSLGGRLPRVFYDPDTSRTIVRFLKFHDLATCNGQFSPEGHVEIEINISDLIKTARYRELILRHKVEEIILESFYSKLINLDLLKHKFRPIYMLLNQLLSQGKISPVMVAGLRNDKRMMKYLTFLEQVGLLRRNANNDYVQANIPLELSRQLSKASLKEKLALLFGYAIKEGYVYLEKEMNVISAKVYFDILAAYYQASYQMEKPLKYDSDQFYRLFLSFGGRKDKLHFDSYLRDLEAAGFLRIDNQSRFYGEKVDVISDRLAAIV